MAREKKQSEPEQQAGAPEWMVTFSDCMTLLLTFFVLLLSFSSFDDQDDIINVLSSFSNELSFNRQEASEKDAVSSSKERAPDQELQWGSEKATFSEGKENRSKEMEGPRDFLKYKTFLMLSSNAFWGNGSVISTEGKKGLSDFSNLLKEFPNQMVIISETGQKTANYPGDIGFQRAWAVLDYLTTEKGFDPKRFSLSATGTAAKGYHLNGTRQSASAPSDRILEIVLLERRL